MRHIKKAQAGLKAASKITRATRPVIKKETATLVRSAKPLGSAKPSGTNVIKRPNFSQSFEDAINEFNRNRFRRNINRTDFGKGGNVNKAKGGKQMLKRADGSTSQRGLWDNIRAAAKRNKAAGRPGKKPTAAMLKQERKIKAKGK